MARRQATGDEIAERKEKRARQREQRLEARALREGWVPSTERMARMVERQCDWAETSPDPRDSTRAFVAVVGACRLAVEVEKLEREKEQTPQELHQHVHLHQVDPTRAALDELTQDANYLAYLRSNRSTDARTAGIGGQLGAVVVRQTSPDAGRHGDAAADPARNGHGNANGHATRPGNRGTAKTRKK